MGRNLDCIISFHEDGLSVAIGYVENGLPHVLNAVGVEYPSLLVGGRLKDVSEGILCISRALDQAMSSLDGLSIHSAGILLPSSDARIDMVMAEYPTSNGICQEKDISNCLGLFKSKLGIEERRELVDILPISYRTDDGRSFGVDAPIGIQTGKLELTAARIFSKDMDRSTFIESVMESGLDVSFVNVSSYAIGRYFAGKVTDGTALVLSFGENSIDVSTLKDGLVVGLDRLSFGYGYVLDSLSSDLSIGRDRAYELLTTIGLSQIVGSPFILDDGISMSDFSDCASKSVSRFLERIKKSIDGVERYDHVVASGDFSTIPGFVASMREVLGCSILPGTIDAIGARRRSFADLVGGLLMANDHCHEDVVLTKTSILTRKAEG